MPLNENEINALWLEYSKVPSIKNKQKLVLNYIWLVKYVLQNMQIPQNPVLESQDFVSFGIIGLQDAIERFEPERGVKFESFAIPRIKGTIQDELRRLDWLSRTARKKAQDYLQAGDSIRSTLGREASQEEIMKHLNVTPEQYDKYLKAAEAAKIANSFNDMSNINIVDDEEQSISFEIPDLEQIDALTQMENRERISIIYKFLNSLKSKKRIVITLYYYENLSFKEIGKVLNISESRACQIHTQVIKSLREELLVYNNT